MNILSEKKVHEHGFVRLVGVFGNDQDICESARISYLTKTKKKGSEDRDLIRYLVRHRHTSPLEQAEVRFHLKLPIFVMRQLVRHRTANINEQSARYSVLDTEFYTPAALHHQSKTNKQGSGDIHKNTDHHIKHFEDVYKISATYYDEMIEDDVSRELARGVIPVNVYTECIWKCDIHNLLHFLKLRTDSHAQQEIQDFANPMEDMARVYFPLTFEAYDDYIKHAISLSRMDICALQDMVAGVFVDDRHHYKMGEREWKEFVSRWVSKDK